MGIVRVRSKFWGSIISLEGVKLSISNLVCRLILACVIDYRKRGCVQGYATFVIFGKQLNILETVQGRGIVTMED